MVLPRGKGRGCRWIYSLFSIIKFYDKSQQDSYHLEGGEEGGRGDLLHSMAIKSTIAKSWISVF